VPEKLALVNRRDAAPHYNTPKHHQNNSFFLGTSSSMLRPTTPDNSSVHLSPHKRYKHYTTPLKARVLGAIEFNHHQGYKGLNNEVFKYYGISKRSGYNILSGHSSGTDRRLNNEPRAIETRGAKPILTRGDLRRMEDYLENADIRERAVTWQNLAEQCGIQRDPPISGRTIQRAMGSLDYHKCIACDKAWVAPDVRADRRSFAREQLTERPTVHEWKNVRWSDEVHFGLGPQRKLRIIRRPGERHVFKRELHQKRRIRRSFMLGRILDGTTR
jgi:hypothetical protein